MPGFLLGAGLVEQAARHEGRGNRIVARAAGLTGDDGRGTLRGAAVPRRSRRRVFQFLVQRLQHAGGFLAAGHAEVEPRFALACDRVGIIVAIIAALAAILLRHRGHHPPPQRPAFGKLHAVGDRHGLVVPRRFTIVAVPAALQQGRALLRRQRHRAVELQQPDQEAVEPGALGFGKRRAFRNDFEPRRRGQLVHVDALRIRHLLQAFAIVAARKVPGTSRRPTRGWRDRPSAVARRSSARPRP